MQFTCKKTKLIVVTEADLKQRCTFEPIPPETFNSIQLKLSRHSLLFHLTNCFKMKTLNLYNYQTCMVLMPEFQ